MELMVTGPGPRRWRRLPGWVSAYRRIGRRFELRGDRKAAPESLLSQRCYLSTARRSSQRASRWLRQEPPGYRRPSPNVRGAWRRQEPPGYRRPSPNVRGAWRRQEPPGYSAASQRARGAWLRQEPPGYRRPSPNVREARGSVRSLLVMAPPPNVREAPGAVRSLLVIGDRRPTCARRVAPSGASWL
jgi:hypothetical protein